MERLIVSFTSWTKRIKSCYDCVLSIFDNTMQPDLVYLNLSVEEFPNMENDLPKELLFYSKIEPRFKIHWVYGENTKTMKKVFPILDYLDDDDIIIIVDDDIIPKGLIKSRYNDFVAHSKKCAISSNAGASYLNGMYGGISPIWGFSLFTKRMMRNYDKFLTNELVHTYNDDALYSAIIFTNGYKTVWASDYLTSRYRACKHRIIDTGGDTSVRKLNKSVYLTSSSDAYIKMITPIIEKYRVN